jgi:hypothetical protein
MCGERQLRPHFDRSCEVQRMAADRPFISKAQLSDATRAMVRCGLVALPQDKKFLLCITDYPKFGIMLLVEA